MLNKELLLAQGKTTATLRIHGLAKWVYNGDDYYATWVDIFVVSVAGDYGDPIHVFPMGEASPSYKEVPFDFKTTLPIGSWVNLNTGNWSTVTAYSGGLAFTDPERNPASPPTLGGQLPYGYGYNLYFELKDDADIEMISQNTP